jgi:hypothetical protein
MKTIPNLPETEQGICHLSLINCHLSLAVTLRAVVFIDVAPKAHPEMTNGN